MIVDIVAYPMVQMAYLYRIGLLIYTSILSTISSIIAVNSVFITIIKYLGCSVLIAAFVYWWLAYNEACWLDVSETNIWSYLHIANRTSERVRLIPPKYAPDASQRAGWAFLHPSQCIRPTFTVIYTHLSTLLCITTKSLSVTWWI